jgi:hypothetical protein
MVYGILPGTGIQESDRMNNIKDNEITFPTDIEVSYDVKDFLRGCLKYNEVERFTW